MITISKKAYLRFLVNSEILHRLYAGGVDNWEWFDESLNPDNEPNMEEFKREVQNGM